MTWIDQLLENVRVLFTELYSDQLTKPNTSNIVCPFDHYFDRQVADLEKLNVENGPPPPSIVTNDPTSNDQSGFSSDEAPRKGA